ncbi:unnamed protein product [Rotaria sp. Silwood2]|nr:unnamed protein product [Rotaria sp. Silwood2]CAF2816837.1 unnamed protein product [Rotaria sp. Silwood2]CAF3234815.1 unnamed protein product [Rotaria sp. Silwood2]CAF3889067.1 unnamed protein product [Rotaria sp. Silwood2]CAF3938765.1 unnamed protein product [Rotaria sp. Silwood2]
MENSLSFWSDDENVDEFDEHEQHPYYVLDGIQTRMVWVTNYINNEDFSINVPVDDPVLQLASTFSDTIDVEPLLLKNKDDESLVNKIHTLDLSKLNLDDLLLLLYRLQQKTTKNSVATSPSTTSSSSTSSSSSSGFIERQPSCKISSQMSIRHPLNSRHSHTVHSSLSMLNEIPSYSHTNNRQQTSFSLSNMADVPKQLTTTLAKPISSFHAHNTKHIHSPNDVVDKLLQSFNLQNYNQNNQKFIEHKLQRCSSRYTYQQSQQHKAKLISNLLSSNSIRKLPCHLHQNNSYH